MTLSELLALRLNGIDVKSMGHSVDSLQKLLEENGHLRTLIAHMSANETGDPLIRSLADVFRCEQQRRSVQVGQHPNFDLLEQEIHEMCEYQRDALGKLLAGTRPSSAADSQHAKSNKYCLKYLRCENYRKALVYQKRYLLILLTGYADTEAYALNEIRRLTGDVHADSPRDRYFPDKRQSVRKPLSHRQQVNYRFRFRYHVRAVIAVTRMRCLARKWSRTVSSMQ